MKQYIAQVSTFTDFALADLAALASQGRPGGPQICQTSTESISSI
jgi:hypothetical protein